MNHTPIKSLYPADVVAQNLERGGRFSSGLFHDNVDSQEMKAPVEIDGKVFNSAVVVEKGAPHWEQSPKFDAFMGEMGKAWKKVRESLVAHRNGRLMNAAQFPADYYTFINLLRLDITRRRIEAADMTSRMTQETVNLEATKTVLLDEFKPFVGAFEEIKGRGDRFPLMQHATGQEASVLVRLYGLGDVRSLEDELFGNDIFSVSKVADAFIRAFVGLRNDLVFSPIIGATYDSLQTVAADTTGATYDAKLYNTINNAIEKIRALKDPLTDLPIDASRMVLLTAYTDERKINRVINGQLENTKGVTANLSPLSEVVEIWPYKGDIITVGSRKYTYAPCAAGTAFLFVPGSFGGPNFTVTKRPLTYETGRGGDLFAAAREGQIAYFGQAVYNKEFLGQAGGFTTGYGYVVKITLP